MSYRAGFTVLWLHYSLYEKWFLRIQSGLNTNPIPIDILMWLLEFGKRSSSYSLDMTNQPKHAQVKRMKSLFWLKHSFWGNGKGKRVKGVKKMKLIRFQREYWVIAPANTESRTQTKYATSPTLTGVRAVHSAVHRLHSLPLPQALWRFCLDDQWQLCKKKTQHLQELSDGRCAQACEWWNVKKS